MKQCLCVLAACLFSLPLLVCAQTVDASVAFLTEDNAEEISELIEHSSIAIEGSAGLRESKDGYVPTCYCLTANRVNDRLYISGVVPPCSLETSRLHYTICDSILVVYLELVPDAQNGVSCIAVDFGPCTADHYTLYARHNIATSIALQAGYYTEDIHSDVYSALPLGSARGQGHLDILTDAPQTGEPITAQFGLDWYGGVDSLVITSVMVRDKEVLIDGTCRCGNGFSTHAHAMVTIDDLPLPGNYYVSAHITDTEGQMSGANASCVVNVTAGEGWQDPRTMADFRGEVNIPSNICEGSPFLVEARWDGLVLTDNERLLPTMQVDSVREKNVFVSVHYDTTADIPNNYEYSYCKVAVPGLLGGTNTLVFTGVDEAGHYNYPPCRQDFYVDYATYKDTLFIGEAGSRYADTEGRNELNFTFIGDSLHVQGLIWMQCNYKHELTSLIHAEHIELRAFLNNSRDHEAARYPVDFYLSPCPMDKYTVVVAGRGKTGAVRDTFRIERPQVPADIWSADSEWEVCYTQEPVGLGLVNVRDCFRLATADDGYLALEKTEYVDGVPLFHTVQGYIRSEGDTLIYVRPVWEDGSIGEECLLYDFREPFEYGGTLRFGIRRPGEKSAEVQEIPIDWRVDSLDYYMLNNGDKHCLPALRGIVFGYGCIEGPMEMFLRQEAAPKKSQPKPSNISHVIFTTKGGQKATPMRNGDGGQDVVVPYDKLLQTNTVWECLEVSMSQPDKVDTYTIVVKGDTLVEEHRCMQVCCLEKQIRQTMFEEGRKIYVVTSNDTPEVLLDFGLQQGDRLSDVSQVLSTGSIQNQGYSYRTIVIDSGQDGCAWWAGDPESPYLYTLIEGVGISKDLFLTGQHPFSKGETISYLLRCWRGGDLVYQAPAYDALLSIAPLSPDDDSTLYDLLGRPVTHPYPGIYIQNGRKVMVRKK